MLIPSSHPGAVRAVSFAAHPGAPALPVGSPVAFDHSKLAWVPYKQPREQSVVEVKSHPTVPATAGVWMLHVNGIAFQFSYKANPADVQNDINAIFADLGLSHRVTTEGINGANLSVPGAAISVSFSHDAGDPTIRLFNVTLTGGKFGLARPSVGEQLNGTNEIRGFVAGPPGDEIQLSSSDPVQGQIMASGLIDRSDVNDEILAVLDGSPTQEEMDVALRSPKLRDIGLFVAGLTGVS